MVVAYKQGSFVHVGCDTLYVDDLGNLLYGGVKYWKPNDADVLIAGVGDTHVITHLKHSMPFRPDVPDKDNVYEYLLQTLNALPNAKSFSFMVLGSAKIFVAQSNGLVYEAEHFEAIGYGRSIAIGSLNTCSFLKVNAEDAIRYALIAAMKYNSNVGGSIELTSI